MRSCVRALVDACVGNGVLCVYVCLLLRCVFVLYVYELKHTHARTQIIYIYIYIYILYIHPLIHPSIYSPPTLSTNYLFVITHPAPHPPFARVLSVLREYYSKTESHYTPVWSICRCQHMLYSVNTLPLNLVLIIDNKMSYDR